MQRELAEAREALAKAQTEAAATAEEARRIQAEARAAAEAAERKAAATSDRARVEQRRLSAVEAERKAAAEEKQRRRSAVEAERKAAAAAERAEAEQRRQSALEAERKKGAADERAAKDTATRLRAMRDQASAARPAVKSTARPSSAPEARVRRAVVPIAERHDPLATEGPTDKELAVSASAPEVIQRILLDQDGVLAVACAGGLWKLNWKYRAKGVKIDERSKIPQELRAGKRATLLRPEPEAPK
jgi:hypothetical protein